MNLLANKNVAVVAKEDVTFAALGLNDVDKIQRIIYYNDSTKVYQPSLPDQFNAILGFEKNKGYLIFAKQNLQIDQLAPMLPQTTGEELEALLLNLSLTNVGLDICVNIAIDPVLTPVDFIEIKSYRYYPSSFEDAPISTYAIASSGSNSEGLQLFDAYIDDNIVRGLQRETFYLAKGIKDGKQVTLTAFKSIKIEDGNQYVFERDTAPVVVNGYEANQVFVDGNAIDSLYSNINIVEPRPIVRKRIINQTAFGKFTSPPETLATTGVFSGIAFYLYRYQINTTSLDADYFTTFRARFLISDNSNLTPPAANRLPDWGLTIDGATLDAHTLTIRENTATVATVNNLPRHAIIFLRKEKNATQIIYKIYTSEDYGKTIVLRHTFAPLSTSFENYYIRFHLATAADQRLTAPIYMYLPPPE